MTRLGFLSLTSLLSLVSLLAPTPTRAQADTNSPAPEFKEVYDLIHEHLVGVSEVDLNRAAVQALVSGLSPKVAIVGATPAGMSGKGALVSKTSLFDGQIGYLRIQRVADGLSEAVRQAYSHLNTTNELSGLVLDLRFADGQDYAAAAATADMFLSKARPLLDWGHGVVQAKQKSDALTIPLAVMVNHETSGAAEALAAVLRETGAGLILGSRTSGQAAIAQDYPLKGGDHLRIAIAPVHLGDGSDLTSEGVKPDISVPVALAAERGYYADAFRDPVRTNLVATPSPPGTNGPTASNRVRRPRFNEAELVRERRDGYLPDLDAPEGADADLDKNVVRDPVLARALDVLKGLAVVRRARS